MPPNPTKGKFCKLVTLLGTVETVFPAANWDLGIDGHLMDYSNFRDGRWASETLDDADISFEVLGDDNAPADQTPNFHFKTGQTGTLRCYINNAQTRFFEVPCKIGTVKPSVKGLEDVLRWPVTAKLCGDVTWPS